MSRLFSKCRDFSVSSGVCSYLELFRSGKVSLACYTHTCTGEYFCAVVHFVYFGSMIDDVAVPTSLTFGSCFEADVLYTHTYTHSHLQFMSNSGLITILW